MPIHSQLMIKWWKVTFREKYVGYETWSKPHPYPLGDDVLVVAEDERRAMKLAVDYCERKSPGCTTGWVPKAKNMVMVCEE